MTNIVISAIRSGIRYESLIPRFGICIDLGYLVFDCLGELPIFLVGVLMFIAIRTRSHLIYVGITKHSCMGPT